MTTLKTNYDYFVIADSYTDRSFRFFNQDPIYYT